MRGGARANAGRKAKGDDTPKETRKRTLPEAMRANVWKPGVSPNPAGRPKGARNKLGEQFLQDMLSAWEEKGKAAIDQVIADRPHEFIKTVASILPKEMHIKTEAVQELSDDELADALAALRAVTIAAAAREGSGTPEGEQPASGLPTLQ